MNRATPTRFQIPTSWRWHKRSWLFAAVLVLTPWVLVAGPGVQISGGGTTGISFSSYIYGWPLVHARECQVEYSGTWTNGVLAYGVKPTNHDFDLDAENWMANSDADGQVAWNPRLQPLPLGSTNPPESVGFWPNRQDRYWSEISNWPGLSSADGVSRRINFWAVVGNLCLAFIGIACMAAIIELSQRRGFKFFQFSIAKLLILLSLIAIGTAFVKSEYDRASVEHADLHTIFANDQIRAWGDFSEPKRPQLLSNLFDNRLRLPGSEIPLWTPAAKVHISMDSKSEQTVDNGFVAAICQLKCPITLELPTRSTFTPTLHQVALANIVELDFFRGDVDIRDDETDQLNPDALVSIPRSMPSLKRISIELEAGEDQTRQLRPCFELESLSTLDKLTLAAVNESGFEFVLANRTRFPPTLICVPDVEVPKLMLARLKAAGITVGTLPVEDFH